MYLLPCMAVVVRAETLEPLQCRDGGRRVFTDQADIARGHDKKHTTRQDATRTDGLLTPGDANLRRRVTRSAFPNPRPLLKEGRGQRSTYPITAPPGTLNPCATRQTPTRCTRERCGSIWHQANDQPTHAPSAPPPNKKYDGGRGV